jgi:hypothetical protein
MYADVAVTGVTGASALAIPRSAVQNVGDRTVDYLANPKEQGKFTEREVRLGQTSGEQQIQVVSGVPAGDVLVNDGSFYLRAERERLGARPAPAAVGATAPDRSVESGSAGDVRSAKITSGSRDRDRAPTESVSVGRCPSTAQATSATRRCRCRRMPHTRGPRRQNQRASGRRQIHQTGDTDNGHPRTHPFTEPQPECETACDLLDSNEAGDYRHSHCVGTPRERARVTTGNPV